jgi:hydroxymethylbilane synthase
LVALDCSLRLAALNAHGRAYVSRLTSARLGAADRRSGIVFGVRTLRLATRGSEQARAQSGLIAERLRAVGHVVELVLVETSGDTNRHLPIWEIGGRGVFVKEVQRAVLERRADLAVHSAKDLPSSIHAEGLVLACVPERGDPRDALAGSTLDGLRPGAVVATGSRRRQAQLAHLRPDLAFTGLRGNIPKRVAAGRSPGIDASIVAVAGARLVGLESQLDQVFEPDQMVPQVGQGALAIECRSDDDDLRAILAAIEHPAARRAVDAERAFLSTLGGGCELPVGAYAVVHGDNIRIAGVVGSVDGAQLYKAELTGSDQRVGARLAERLLDLGAAALLHDFR